MQQETCRISSKTTSIARGSAADDYLADDMIIAPITPLSLGGEMGPKNSGEEIIAYYQSTATDLCQGVHPDGEGG